jgi:predicted DNA-binding transcriptional regulator AlpA
MDNRLLNRNEAAQFLGVSPQTLAYWACTKRYELPLVKIGRLAKYRMSDLEAFINNCTRSLKKV